MSYQQRKHKRWEKQQAKILVHEQDKAKAQYNNLKQKKVQFTWTKGGYGYQMPKQTGFNYKGKRVEPVKEKKIWKKKPNPKTEQGGEKQDSKISKDKASKNNTEEDFVWGLLGESSGRFDYWVKYPKKIPNIRKMPEPTGWGDEFEDNKGDSKAEISGLF